eukprot:TRINITY_DN69726_c0_g1_i1.p2 TRINITY_DN69726_c0_g1~~TRINITY_DN69726_c0_g1_i1.p2  ORF type:complete len:159 (-),score=49.13 TRINITY_DN69726_c0_g1_i1:41-517(-)
MCQIVLFFFSSRRRHTRCREVSWARRCVQETDQRRVHGHKINLTNNNMNQSEVFFLQPNDLVYIPPTKLKMRSENESSYALVLSTISTLLIILTLIKQQTLKQGKMEKIEDILSRIDSHPVSYTHLTLPTILLVQISVVAVSLKKIQQQKTSEYNKTS